MIPTRLLAIAGAVAIVAGASAAQADMRFENGTDARLRFEVQCHGGGTVDTWTIAPYGTGNIYCTNGADAELRVYTRMQDGRVATTYGTVYDGGTYRLHYLPNGSVGVTGWD
jgi:hypothetical protein